MGDGDDGVPLSIDVRVQLLIEIVVERVHALIVTHKYSSNVNKRTGLPQIT